MFEKYNLAEMMEEIQEDDALENKKSLDVSQEEIKKMITKMQKQRNVND